MEKKSLSLRYNPLKRALKKLESSVKRSQDPRIVDEFNEIQDSKIQRFEYTLDGLWKYVGDYLVCQGVTVRQYNPKDIFRAAYISKIIGEHEFAVLLNAVDSRNRTSHDYGGDLSKIIAKEIDTYYVIISSIIERLDPDKI